MLWVAVEQIALHDIDIRGVSQRGRQEPGEPIVVNVECKARIIGNGGSVESALQPVVRQLQHIQQGLRRGHHGGKWGAPIPPGRLRKRGEHPPPPMFSGNPKFKTV